MGVGRGVNVRWFLKGGRGRLRRGRGPRVSVVRGLVKGEGKRSIRFYCDSLIVI